MHTNIIFAFLVTLFAGLSTGFGALIALLVKRTDTRFLSMALGFSAGVMIYVSFMELMPSALGDLTGEVGEALAKWYVLLAFFGGMVIIALIDKLIPEDKNPHTMLPEDEIEGYHQQDLEGLRKKHGGEKNLYTTGVKTALSIAIHNFPEGMATFAAALKDPALGVSIAIAIAIHNIPEGMSVAVPIYYSTGDRRKSFVLAFVSGLAEPLGALAAYFFLADHLNATVLAIVFAAVAGIMVFISFDELLPASEEYGAHHLSLYGLIGGMLLMAVSLNLL